MRKLRVINIINDNGMYTWLKQLHTAECLCIRERYEFAILLWSPNISLLQLIFLFASFSLSVL